MAASVTTSRAIYAGLSCGVAFAVPVCAYAVTLPFPAANGIVATCALPFTVGALAGVGLVTAMGAVADARADAHDEDVAVGEHEASHAAGAHGSDEHHHSAHAGSRFFGKRGMPRDVPVIARASGAPSEEDAWAEIDALFSEDSPISCDAAHSKDIYEIAFEELRRNAAPGAAAAAAGAAAAPAAASAAPHHAAHAGYAPTSWQAPAGASAAMTGAPVAAPARPATASPTASQAWQAAPAASAATSTAMFMALAQQRAAAHAASAPANTNAFMPQAGATRTSAQATPTSTSYAAPAARAQATAGMAASSYAGAPARPMAQPADAADAPFDRDADARAALASLDRFGSERLARSVTGSMPAQAAAAPAAQATSVAWATNPAARPAAAAAPVAPSAPAAQPAASADAFADRRSVWAAALDILAEPEEPVHPAPATTAATARRASAIAEGKRANRMHEHVNELIEQELGQVASPAVQHSSREYLRVIQGGTASMPALQAEA